MVRLLLWLRLHQVLLQPPFVIPVLFFIDVELEAVGKLDSVLGLIVAVDIAGQYSAIL